MTPLESHAIVWPLVFGVVFAITAAIRVIAYTLDAALEAEAGAGVAESEADE